MAEGLVDAAFMIAGEQASVGWESLQPEDSPEVFRARIAARIEDLDGGDGVLVLADLFGATPANSAIYLVSGSDGPERVEILTGVNLPMLLEAVMRRDLPLRDLARVAAEAAHAGIMNAEVSKACR